MTPGPSRLRDPSSAKVPTPRPRASGDPEADARVDTVATGGAAADAAAGRRALRREVLDLVAALALMAASWLLAGALL